MYRQPTQERIALMETKGFSTVGFLYKCNVCEWTTPQYSPWKPKWLNALHYLESHKTWDKWDKGHTHRRGCTSLFSDDDIYQTDEVILKSIREGAVDCVVGEGQGYKLTKKNQDIYNAIFKERDDRIARENSRMKATRAREEAKAMGQEPTGQETEQSTDLSPLQRIGAPKLDGETKEAEGVESTPKLDGEAEGADGVESTEERAEQAADVEQDKETEEQMETSAPREEKRKHSLGEEPEAKYQKA